MKGDAVFKVILSDRHCDDTVKLFADEADARMCAEQYARGIEAHYGAKPDTKLTESAIRAGWLYRAYLEDAADVHIEHGIIE